MSCPAVVKPWEPLPIPLSQLPSQSQSASIHFQRSSSVHPLSDDSVKSKHDQKAGFQRASFTDKNDDSSLKTKGQPKLNEDLKTCPDTSLPHFISPIYPGPDTFHTQSETEKNTSHSIREISTSSTDATLQTETNKNVSYRTQLGLQQSFSGACNISQLYEGKTKDDVKETTPVSAHYDPVQGNTNNLAPPKQPNEGRKQLGGEDYDEISEKANFKQTNEIPCHEHIGDHESLEQASISYEPSQSDIWESQHVGKISYSHLVSKSSSKQQGFPSAVSQLSSSVSSLSDHQVAPPDVDALTTAAAAGDISEVKSLLMKGVDVNMPNSFGRTALQVMVHDNADLAEVLLQAGADPNARDVGRRTAASTLRTIAHDVAASGFNDVLCCLLQYGADISLEDRWGNTPLHLAAKAGHLSTVRFLRKGSSLHTPNRLGKTPLNLLEESNNFLIRQWVKKRKSTVPHLRTLCTLAVRKELRADGLRCWTKHGPDEAIRQQILLQKNKAPGHILSDSTSLSTKCSVKAQEKPQGQDNTCGPSLIFSGEQAAEMLSLRDLVPRRLSSGENTSLEVQNASSIHSDDMSLGAQVSGCLMSENSSVFENTFSSVEPSHDEFSFSSDQFTEELVE